jgi:hypothetical protein
VVAHSAGIASVSHGQGRVSRSSRRPRAVAADLVVLHPHSDHVLARAAADHERPRTQGAAFGRPTRAHRTAIGCSSGAQRIGSRSRARGVRSLRTGAATGSPRFREIRGDGRDRLRRGRDASIGSEGISAAEMSRVSRRSGTLAQATHSLPSVAVDPVASDARFIQRLTEAGCDFSKSRHVGVHFDAATVKAANAVIKALSSEPDLLRDPEVFAHTDAWLVYSETWMLVTETTIAALRQRMEGIAATAGGVYAGWQTSAVP